MCVCVCVRVYVRVCLLLLLFTSILCHINGIIDCKKLIKLSSIKVYERVTEGKSSGSS